VGADLEQVPVHLARGSEGIVATLAHALEWVLSQVGHFRGT
jgi:hypothetical protein